MRNLILFFIKYNGFFLFVLLEAIGIYLLVQERNPKQHAHFAATTNRLVGFLTERVSKVTRYWDLESENKRLANENKQLHEKLRSAYFDDRVQRDTLETDSLRYRYIVAEVVDNSTSRLNNYLLLNRGSSHGVRPNMGVINGSGDGILGIVRSVSTNFSTVMSVLHMDTRISAKLRRNNFFGTLGWDGRSARHLVLDAIPKHAQVLRGDTVVTSGFSGIFPKDVVVGVVDTFWLEPGSSFYTINVLLSGDLSNTGYGFVVEDVMEKELKDLGVQLDKIDAE
jgi:rod shape-determining protein MreC